MFRSAILLLLSTFGVVSCGGEVFQIPDGVFTGSSTGDGGLAHLDPTVTPPRFRVEQGEGGRLQILSDLPRRAEACEARHAPEFCVDLDEDGLTDLWEDLVLDALAPLVRFDEEEKLFYDPAAVFTGVGRVSPAAEDPALVRVHLVIAHSRDYGCMSFSDHDGDSERVVLDLEPLETPSLGDAVLRQAYTAAHECTVGDHSERYSGRELEELEFEDDPFTEAPRWVVYSSRNKHASYITKAVCEPTFTGCFESCAPDRVRDPSLFDLRPLVANAGEPEAPRLTDLSAIGFPGEEAWVDQKFCGGRERGGGCSTSIRTKLLMAPGQCP